MISNALNWPEIIYVNSTCSARSSNLLLDVSWHFLDKMLKFWCSRCARIFAASRLCFDCSLIHIIQIWVTDLRDSGNFYARVMHGLEISLWCKWIDIAIVMRIAIVRIATVKKKKSKSLLMTFLAYATHLIKCNQETPQFFPPSELNHFNFGTFNFGGFRARFMNRWLDCSKSISST